MSLSAHEKIQFERLTADLEFDDADLKKMVKRERATSMSYVALPRIRSWSSEIIVTVMLLLLGLASIPVAFLFLRDGNFVAVGITLFFGAVALGVSTYAWDQIPRKAKQEK